MGKSNMVYKNVAFNIDDPDQEKQLEHSELRKNFSGYVKRLIQRDIDNSFAPKVIYGVQQEIKEDQVELSSNLMVGLT